TGYREDIPQIMSCLDIAVLPSTSHLEGLSRVIIEAMASGKPVIATDAGGNPEAVEDGKTGILVPPGEPDRLARAILELARDANKRKRMGEAGRKRAEQLFSIEMNVTRIEKIYEEILCPPM
ncbi:MAG: glycosyltransferase, partial [Candidatus Aminicenantes bacterium]|nr:glycosyltransferase [Candidatus Aminicenantes bacterium]